MKKKFFATAALASLILTPTLAAPALAAPAVVTPPAVNVPNHGLEEVKAWFEKYDVPVETQETIVKKLENGVLLNSMDGSKPVKEETFQTPSEIGTRSTFADGSISITSVNDSSQSASNAVTPYAVSNCVVTGGSGWGRWSNCSVNISNGVISMAFMATFERYQGVDPKIVSVWSATSKSSYGTITKPTLKIHKKQGNPALAVAKAKYRAYNGVREQEPELWLKVTRSGFTSYTAGA